MNDRRVYETEYGWVAADEAGWIPTIYDTEAEARAAVGLDLIDRGDDASAS